MKFNNNFEYISKEDVEKLKSCKLNHSVNVRINGIIKKIKCSSPDKSCHDCFFTLYCNNIKWYKYRIPCCDWEKDDSESCTYEEIK